MLMLSIQNRLKSGHSRVSENVGGLFSPQCSVDEAILRRGVQPMQDKDILSMVSVAWCLESTVVSWKEERRLHKQTAHSKKVFAFF